METNKLIFVLQNRQKRLIYRLGNYNWTLDTLDNNSRSSFCSKYELTNIIFFSSYIMEKIDLVLVGAEGVVESGGIINKVSYNILSRFPGDLSY